MANAIAGRDRREIRRSWSAVALAYRVYDTLIAAVVWTMLVPFTAVQIVRGRATLSVLYERLGLAAGPPAAPARIVVHAVSAGEAMAAGAFVRALREERPEWSVILTYGNRDAHTIALALQRQLPTIEAVVALPWDRAAAVRRWLRAVQPSAVVVVEPEIWPNLYRACGALRIALFLVNGHLRPRDVERYRAVRPFFADALSVPAWIGVQSETERERFAALGAPIERIDVTDSLKFDVAIDRSDTALRRLIGAARHAIHPLLVAGSTHRLEEGLLIRALESLRPRFPTLRLILVPRDVTRADRIVARVRAHGHRVVKASALEGEPWDVVVVDRLGELPLLYELADIAFVGGTLAPCGGHNVIEPARAGCAIVVGPHVQNVRHLVDGLGSVDGIVQLSDDSADALRDAVDGLLSDVVRRRRLGLRAESYAASRRGAARRSVAAMLERLAARVEREPATPSRDHAPAIGRRTPASV